MGMETATMDNEQHQSALSHNKHTTRNNVVKPLRALCCPLRTRMLRRGRFRHQAWLCNSGNAQPGRQKHGANMTSPMGNDANASSQNLSVAQTVQSLRTQ